MHHSDRGTQYLSMRYTDRLMEAGIEPSVGSRRDSYDNALAESIIGLFKTEVIQRKGPWRHLEAVEFATLTWVDWFNTRRLLEPIGYVPPAEYEARSYEQQRRPTPKRRRRRRGDTAACIDRRSSLLGRPMRSSFAPSALNSPPCQIQGGGARRHPHPRIEVPRVGRQAPAWLSATTDKGGELTHTNRSPINPVHFRPPTLPRRRRQVPTRND